MHDTHTKMQLREIYYAWMKNYRAWKQKHTCCCSSFTAFLIHFQEGFVNHTGDKQILAAWDSGKVSRCPIKKILHSHLWRRKKKITNAVRYFYKTNYVTQITPRYTFSNGDQDCNITQNYATCNILDLKGCMEWK